LTASWQYSHATASCQGEEILYNPNVFRTVLVFPIRVYRRVISPLLPRRCRFHPTCSEYAIEAITKHGILKGGRLALKRLLRCHPLHPGGYDPVP